MGLGRLFTQSVVQPVVGDGHTPDCGAVNADGSELTDWHALRAGPKPDTMPGVHGTVMVDGELVTDYCGQASAPPIVERD